MATHHPTTEPDPPKVGDLLHDIGNDVRTIAVDELELARTKLASFLESLVAKMSGAILGACVALIGLAMISVAAVVALAPVIDSLAVRLVLMAIVYLLVGGVGVIVYVKRLEALHTPELGITQTVEAVERGMEH